MIRIGEEKKKSLCVLLIVAMVLCNIGNFAFAKATDSEVEKETVSSVSEMVVEEGDEEEPLEDDMSDVEEPEEDPTDASPSDIEGSDDTEVETGDGFLEPDDDITTPSEASPSDMEEEEEEVKAAPMFLGSFLKSKASPSSTIKASPSSTTKASVSEIASKSEFKGELSVPMLKAAPATPTPVYMWCEGTTFHYTSAAPPASTPSLLYNPGTPPYGMNNVSSFLYGLTPSINTTDITDVIIDDDLYPDNCRAMFYAFSNITGITNLNKLHTDKATSINGIFSGCSSITSLDISHFVVTSACTDISYLFAGTGISTIAIPAGWDISGVEDMSVMFYSCPNLTSVDLSKFNTKSVTDMHNMFYNCPNLRTVDLSSFNTSSASTVRGMFNGCSNLQNIYVGPGFVIPGGCDSTDMFLGCTKLPGYDPTKTDGTMVAVYTRSKPSPSPAPKPYRPSGGSGGSGGGGKSVVSRKYDPEKIAASIHQGRKNVSSYDMMTTAFFYDAPHDKWYLIKNINGNQTFVVNEFCNFNNGTYYFDQNGVMSNGWVKDIDGNYYLFEWNKGLTQGQMIRGWKKVNDFWYYFDKDGKMLVNTTTPDGYVVGADGAWINNIAPSV